MHCKADYFSKNLSSNLGAWQRYRGILRSLGLAPSMFHLEIPLSYFLLNTNLDMLYWKKSLKNILNQKM